MKVTYGSFRPNIFFGRFVGNDFFGRALSEHFAFVDDVGVIANAQRFTYVVVGDQNADAAVFQKTHDALNFDHGDRVDTGKRFVKKNEARVSRQGSGDFRTTSLAARKRQSCIGADVLNLKFIK